MERPYFCDINERNYRVQNCASYWHHVLYVSEGSNHVTVTWKKDFFPLFVRLFYVFFLPSAFLVFFFLPFLSSACFFHLHFSIRIFPSASAIRRYPVRVLQTPFSLSWPASIQIYLNKRKCLHKKRVQLPEDWFATLTWPPFHCLATPIWPPWCHVKTLYTLATL